MPAFSTSGDFDISLHGAQNILFNGMLVAMHRSHSLRFCIAAITYALSIGRWKKRCDRFARPAFPHITFMNKTCTVPINAEQTI
jgi:hypothetical protein